MPPIGAASLLSLEENPREVFLEVTSVLLRLASNVINNPSESKFRSIRLANPTVAKKLLPAVGAMECLFEMGFQEAEGCLVLPSNCSLDNLRAIHDHLLARRNSILSSSPALPAVQENENASSEVPEKAISQPSDSDVPKNPQGKDASNSTSASSVKGVLDAKIISPSSNSSKNTLPKPGFLERIVSSSETVAETHKKELLLRAKTYIPLLDLEAAALEQLRKIQLIIKTQQAQNLDNIASEPSMQELILVQLLSWFKEKFFSWVNNPLCHFCLGKTKFRRTDSRGDLRVEVYECALCLQETDFPRHTNPMELLETRKGRCGEWGRCFTFLCQALGWDSRLIIDETDHVWTEVFVASQSRWIHCDPCENAFDTPLMYELGWKKKLSYILAYSPDDVQDVTWRYSINHKELLRRRQYCTEAQLLETIMAQRKLRQQNLSSSRKAYLLKRTLFELVELWREPSEKDNIYQGRQSGALAWRLARGETSVSANHVPFIWRPSKSEIDQREIRIQYLSGLDLYRRGSRSPGPVDSGWQSGVFTSSHVFRKEEKDWGMVYLAREEGCQVGSVTWCVDLSDSGMVADKVKLALNCKVFENGNVDAVVCGGDCCVKVPINGNSPKTLISTSALSGVSLIKLRIDLSGGIGDEAWQHSQLFRTNLGSEEVGLDISIELKPAKN